MRKKTIFRVPVIILYAVSLILFYNLQFLKITDVIRNCLQSSIQTAHEQNFKKLQNGQIRGILHM